MYKIYAMLRASWLAAASYRLSMVMTIAGLFATVVPVYFVANALQPVMEESIRREGGEYFGFVLIGMIAVSLLSVAMNAVPGAIGGGITTGTLEALLSTRTRLPMLLTGMISYSFVWQGIRTVFLLIAGWWLGVHLAWSHALVALMIMMLIALAYLPIGLIAAALVLTFRTAGPLTRVVLLGSTLLGGVYYPTHVIPSWIERLSAVVPLTYGLRALRRTILEGASVTEVMPDLAMLSAIMAGLLVVGTGAFLLAFQHAKRSGSLAQY
jgi:ABC-2 type transport system permease protein